MLSNINALTAWVLPPNLRASAGYARSPIAVVAPAHESAHCSPCPRIYGQAASDVSLATEALIRSCARSREFRLRSISVA